MPVYAFRCPQCSMEFEVSRKMSEAGKAATCPLDGAVSDRIFTAPARIGRAADPATAPPAQPQQPAGGNWSHFGHSHGFGVGGHSHGAPPRPTPPAGSGES